MSIESVRSIPSAVEVAVWLVDNVPVRLVWDQVRYRVTDTPTPLAEDAWAVELTHAARRVVGWRFQGTTSGGHSLMFEIAESELDSGWVLMRCYE
ncbi:hypothetical protein [Naasia lichenicola]|uniref:Uncharacterized protein n=1 Tax=Naasia lichenicola TaxID=2565933 RepID=A0A4S4FT37_9MICO|nr:hypothetical protein [Naasia lichenicola]THG33488.1 hypothetical protein E6C64_03905 [Naasia lichenicola]